MKKLTLFYFFSILLLGCSSDNDIQLNDGDYLIFGHFYGFCIGENLYEDSNDNYANEPFNFKKLSNERFELTKDLIDFFPSELLSEKETILGCPDCADGGGIYIEYSKDGEVKSWRIDQIKENVPSYLHNFMDKVNTKISLINNN